MNIEQFLYDRFPVAFADGVSSVLHGLAVFIPTLLVGSFVPEMGPVVGAVIADRYWIREDNDRIKAMRLTDKYSRSQKLRDGLRDRWFPVGFWLIGTLIVLL